MNKHTQDCTRFKKIYEGSSMGMDDTARKLRGLLQLRPDKIINLLLPDARQ